MTNLNEATTMMASKAFGLESAQEIARGVCEYTGVKYAPEDSAPYIPAKTITPEDIKWAEERLNTVIPDLVV